MRIVLKFRQPRYVKGATWFIPDIERYAEDVFYLEIGSAAMINPEIMRLRDEYMKEVRKRIEELREEKATWNPEEAVARLNLFTGETARLLFEAAKKVNSCLLECQ